MDDFFLHVADFEAETVFQDGQLMQVLAQEIAEGFSLRAKAFKVEVGHGLWVRAQTERFFGSDLADTDACGVHMIHGFSHELKFKLGAAKGVDAAIRFVDHLRVFHGVLDIKFTGHVYVRKPRRDSGGSQ